MTTHAPVEDRRSGSRISRASSLSDLGWPACTSTFSARFSADY
jgi:hypothetical protein